jgi:threonine synthase
VFCEPASAAAVAGLIKHCPGEGQRVVCVLTGHGLKDPQTALENAGAIVPCDADRAALERAAFG